MLVIMNFYYRFMWSVVKSLLLKLILQKAPNSVVHQHVPVGSLHLMWCREDVHELMYNNALQRKSRKVDMRMCPWSICTSLIPSHPLTKRPWMICPVARGGMLCQDMLSFDCRGWRPGILESHLHMYCTCLHKFAGMFSFCILEL